MTDGRAGRGNRRIELRGLGRTGIEVSRLCFGTLTVSPLQLNLAPGRAAELMRQAVELGVNFFDTADLYGNYHQLAALVGVVGRDRLVLATKTYAATAAAARADLDRACRALGTSYVDVYLLHEQESASTLAGHEGALAAMHELKRDGLVRAVGVSTHYVAGVRAAAQHPLVEVIHPICNLAGLGIPDGGMAAMRAAIEDAGRLDKGIYAMKPLGGGHLGRRAAEALAFVRDIPYIHSVALGIGDVDELRFAAAVIAGRPVPEEVAAATRAQARRVIVEQWCNGCGQCVARCSHGALQLSRGRAVVDPGICTLCGYCAAACPGPYIKVVSRYG